MLQATPVDLRSLNAAARLEVYKNEFPEMRKQPGSPPPAHVVVMRFEDWRNCCFKHPTTFTASTAFECVCDICTTRRASPLWKMLTSKFACDPAIRFELIEHYLNLVEFKWVGKGPYCEERYDQMKTLPAFLDAFKDFASRDNTHPIKHITLLFEWPSSNSWYDDDEEDIAAEERNRRHKYIWQIGSVFGVLRQYSFKGVLCFRKISKPRTDLIRHLIQTCSKGCTFPKSYWHEGPGGDSYDTLTTDTIANELAQAGTYSTPTPTLGFHVV
jgi:hypothetical protein